MSGHVTGPLHVHGIRELVHLLEISKKWKRAIESRLSCRSRPVRARWTTFKWRPPCNQVRRFAVRLHSRTH